MSDKSFSSPLGFVLQTLNVILRQENGQGKLSYLYKNTTALRLLP
jgi:hypothetical protein